MLEQLFPQLTADIRHLPPNKLETVRQADALKESPLLVTDLHRDANEILDKKVTRTFLLSKYLEYLLATTSRNVNILKLRIVVEGCQIYFHSQKSISGKRPERPSTFIHHLRVSRTYYKPLPSPLLLTSILPSTQRDWCTAFRGIPREIPSQVTAETRPFSWLLP
jgi:hypothetical protein